MIMQTDKIKELTAKRKKKFMAYSKTPGTSYKKRIRKYELNILDYKIAIEKIKRQNEQ